VRLGRGCGGARGGGKTGEGGDFWVWTSPLHHGNEPVVLVESKKRGGRGSNQKRGLRKKICTKGPNQPPPNAGLLGTAATGGPGLKKNLTRSKFNPLPRPKQTVT